MMYELAVKRASCDSLLSHFESLWVTFLGRRNFINKSLLNHFEELLNHLIKIPSSAGIRLLYFFFSMRMAFDRPQTLTQLTQWLLSCHTPYNEENRPTGSFAYDFAWIQYMMSMATAMKSTLGHMQVIRLHFYIRLEKRNNVGTTTRQEASTHLFWRKSTDISYTTSPARDLTLVLYCFRSF